MSEILDGLSKENIGDLFDNVHGIGKNYLLIY